LLVVAAGAAALLWLLYPGARPAKQSFALDAVSLAYLRNLVRAQPGDDVTRARLVELELQAANFERAEQTLRPLLAGEGSAAARRLQLQIATGRMNALPAKHAARAHEAKAVVAALDALIARDGSRLGARELEDLAALELTLGRPAAAAAIYERLAAPAGARREPLLVEAARWYEAAGALEHAALLVLEAARLAPAGRAVVHARKALALKRAEGPIAATASLELAEELLARFPDDLPLLSAATRVALGARDLPRARRWGKRALQVARASAPGELGRLVDVLVDAGDLAAARGLLEQLVRARPEDHRLQRRLAEVAAWTHRPHEALEAWTTLAEAGDPHAWSEARALARGLSDQQREARLYQIKAAREALSWDELRRLADCLDSLGEPAAAVAAVRTHGARYQDQVRYWALLSELEERQGGLEAALAASEEVTRRGGLTLPELQRQAELLARLDRPQQALARATQAEPLASDGDLVYWRLYADLAWSQGRDEEAARAYRVLWRTQSRATPLVGERLLALASDAGRTDEIITVGRESYDRFGAADHLVSALGAAQSAGRQADAAALLQKASHSERSFRALPAYWLIKGSVAKAGRDRAGAERAFEQALAAEPDSEDTRLELLWLAIDADDRGLLRRLVRRFGEQEAENRKFWDALATAHEKLGSPERALSFRRRQAEALLAEQKAGDPAAALAAASPLLERPALDEELAGERLSGAWADAGFTRLGALDIVAERARAAVRLGGGALTLAPEAVARQTSLHAPLFVRQRREEYYGGLGLERASDGGRTALSIGVQALPEGALPTGRLAHVFRSGRGELALAGVWNELPLASGGLRAAALESGIHTGFLWQHSEASAARLGLEIDRYGGRTGGLLGWGAAATAELEHRVVQVGQASATVRVDGEDHRSDLPLLLPADTEPLFAPGTTVDDLLVGRYTTAGAGLRLAYGRETLGEGLGAPLRLGLFADVWAGWLWPVGRAAFSLDAGLGLRFGRWQELTLLGSFYANRRGVLDERSLGLTLGYVLRWL
jgi:predicted Zn-dependent protease